MDITDGIKNLLFRAIKIVFKIEDFNLRKIMYIHKNNFRIKIQKVSSYQIQDKLINFLITKKKENTTHQPFIIVILTRNI